MGSVGRSRAWRICLGSIIGRLAPGIIHRRGGRGRSAVVGGGRLLILVDAEGALVLGRRGGGVFLLRGLIRVFCPGQLLMLER